MAAALPPLEVLHCDNHVLAVVKPAGVLAQGDATGDISILEHARAWVKTRFQKPGNVFLGLVHRLDRPVSGVMIFGRTSKGASRLSESFRSRSARKVYLARVTGTVTEGAHLEHTLDDKPCRLRFEPIDRHRGQSLLAVFPETGRKHQIRRQLSSAGYPIVGDRRYGSRVPLPNRRIGLHAHSLTIKHPTRDERLTFTAPTPEFLPSAHWCVPEDL